MKRITYYTKTLLITLFFGCTQLHGENTIHMVTKEVTTNFPSTKKTKLFITGERANITCSAYDGTEIKCTIRVVSKHKSKKTAEEDLKTMVLKTQPVGNHIFLRNFIELTNNRNPESSLKTEYLIEIPKTCPVYIKNYFGSIQVKDLESRLSIISEFTETKIQNILGEVTIQSKFGSIHTENLEGDIKIESNRSNLNLKKLSGNLFINSSMARMELSSFGELNELKIRSTKSQLYISDILPSQFSYKLDLEKVKLDIDERIGPKDLANKLGKHKIEHNMSKNAPLIDIQMQIGTLSLKN